MEFNSAKEIAQGVTEGHAAAEQALVETYGPMLLKILQRRAVVQAEDVCQEAMLVVLLRLRKRGLDEPDKLPQFLRRTALNINIREIRREVRQNTHADSEGIDALAGWNQPDREFVTARRAALVNRVIAELPQERDRQILDLFYIQEQEKSDICDLLGLDDRRVNSVLHRARSRLRRLIETTHAGENDIDADLTEDQTYG